MAPIRDEAKSKAVAGPKMPAKEERKRVRANPGLGSALLDRVEETLRRYVVLPNEEAYIAVSCWVAASHAAPFFDTAPRLAIVSPTKRCGKSRLLDVCEGLSYEPLTTSNATVAALVRSIKASDPPTLFIDEADAVFGTRTKAEQNEDLRGLINSGHQRGKPVLRWDPKARRLETLENFAFAALASIKDLPDTIMDRAVVVRMRRRANGEVVATFRASRHRAPLEALGAELALWVRSYAKDLRAGVPEDAMPVEDRAADTWEPLVAVADLAGGEWPEAVRLAAKKMTKSEATEGESGDSAGLELLQDLRSVWAESEPKLHSRTLLGRLVEIDGGRWSNYRYGRPLDGHEMAQLLKPYTVSSKDVRVDGRVTKGYRRTDLVDVWQRYLSVQTRRSPRVAPETERGATVKIGLPPGKTRKS